MMKYHYSMRRIVKANHSKQTISALREGLFILMDEYGPRIVPDQHSEWYKVSGISKKTFNHTIHTYDNFLTFSFEYFLQDLTEYLSHCETISSVKDGLILLMKYGTLKSANADKQRKYAERKAQIRLAAYKYSDDDWVKILVPLRSAVTAEHQFLEDNVRYELFTIWAGIVRHYFAKWASQGMTVPRSPIWEATATGGPLDTPGPPVCAASTSILAG